MITIANNIKEDIAEKICSYSHPGNTDKCCWVTDGEELWWDEWWNKENCSSAINIMDIHANCHFSDYLEPEQVLGIVLNKNDSYYLEDNKIHELKQQDMYLAYEYVVDNYQQHIEELEMENHQYTIDEICRYL